MLNQVKCCLTSLVLTACVGFCPCPASGSEGTHCSASPIVSPPEKSIYPDTPAGRKLQKWLEVFNRGNYDAMLAFHAQDAPSETAQRRALTDYRIYLMTHGFVPFRVEADGSSFRLLAREALTGLWVSILARLSPQLPHSVISVGMIPAEPPTELALHGRMRQEQIVREAEAALKRMADADAFSGTVLIAKDGRPILKRAYGFASKAYHVPNRTETKFNLASMGKMFTGVAIVQLAQAGRLSLDDTIGKFLPDYPNRDAAAKVTVRMLLTHTGGLGSDVFNEKFRAASKDQFRSVSDLLPLFADAALEFEPGSKWAYSNAGFIVLGAVVEKVSGKSYWDYLRENIFAPAGMQNTDAYEMDRDTPNLATGYTRALARTRAELETRQNNLFLHVVKGTPAGGCFSTVDDLFRFTDALNTHKLLDAEHTELVMRGKVATGRGEDKYAFGFQEEFHNRKRVVGHRGGFQGISTVLSMYPEQGYTVVILSNYDTVAQTVGFLLQEMILRE